MSVTVNAVRESAEAVSVTILSCEPTQQKIAARFGGPGSGWRWIDVPTNTPVILERPHPDTGAESNENLTGSGTAKEGCDSYELAVTPSPPADGNDDGSECSVVGVDTRQVVQKPVLLTTANEDGRVFELLLKWTLVDTPAPPEGLAAEGASEHAERPNNVTEEEAAGDHATSEDNPDEETSAPPQNNTVDDEIEEKGPPSVGSDEAINTNHSEAHTDEVKEPENIVEPKEGEEQPLREQVPQPEFHHYERQWKWKGDVSPALRVDDLSDRHVIIAAVVSVQQLEAPSNRMVTVKLGIEDDNDPSSLVPLLRTKAVTHHIAAKVPQIGSPVLFPLLERVHVHCVLSDMRIQSADSTAADGRGQLRSRTAATRPSSRSSGRISKAETNRNVESRSSNSRTATSSECTFTLPQEMEESDDNNRRNGGVRALLWEKHSHLEGVYTAHGTVRCGSREVELAFFRMTSATYRETYRAHSAAKRAGYCNVEVRAEDIELDVAGENQRLEHNTLVEVWLTQPDADAAVKSGIRPANAATTVPQSSRDASECRHLVLLTSNNCMQPLHFSVSEPFAFLSWAVVSPHQRQGFQETVLRGSVPICPVRPGVWVPLTMKLKSATESASYVKLWYSFSSGTDGVTKGDSVRLPPPSAEDTEDGDSYALRVYLDSCVNLYPLVQFYSREGGARAFRVLIMDPEDEAAVSTSCVMDINDMQLYYGQKTEEHPGQAPIKLLFKRIFSSYRLYHSATSSKMNGNERDNSCSLTFLCRLFAFTSVTEAHVMVNAHCVGEGRVVVFPCGVVADKGNPTSRDIDVHVAIDGTLNPRVVGIKQVAVTSPPPCAVLRIRGEVGRVSCGDKQAAICVRSIQLFHRQQQQKRRGRVIWTDGGLSAVYGCFWLCSGLGGGVREWKSALRSSHVLLLNPRQQKHHQQHHEVSLQCNEFVLCAGGEKLVLCAVFIPKTTEIIDGDAKVRSTASNLLKKLVRKVNKDEKSEPGLRNVQGTMRALNYLEVDLTGSATAQGAVVGTALVNDELLLQLKAEWFKVPPETGAAAVPGISTQRPTYQPSPRLWALRMTFPRQPTEPQVNVYATSSPVAYDEPIDTQKQVSQTHPAKARAHRGVGGKTDVASSRAFYLVRPLRLGGKGKEWVVFIFGDASTTRTRLTAAVGETILENVVVDCLSPPSVPLPGGVIVDCFHGSLHVDKETELQRRAEGERLWRRSLREDPSAQQPCQLFVPFTSLAISADGSDPVVSRYHTLTRCVEDGLLLVGATTSSGKGAIFYYNINENTWHLLPIRAQGDKDKRERKSKDQANIDSEGIGDVDSSQAAAHTSARSITSRHGHTTVCSPTQKCAYVYGGIGVGGAEPEAASAAVCESNKGEKGANPNSKTGPVPNGKVATGFMRDVWCINYAEGTATCMHNGEEREVAAPTSRWRHAAVFHNDTMIVFGGRTAPKCGQALKEVRETETEGTEKSGKRPGDAQVRYEVRDGEEEELMLFRDGLCSCCTLLVFDLTRRTWGTKNTSGAKPAPRYGHATATCATSVYVFGGMTQQRQLLDDMYELDLSTNSWRRMQHNGAVEPPPSHLAAMESITVSNTVCLVLAVGVTGTGESSDSLDRGGDALRLYLFSHASQFWRKLYFNCSPLPAPVGVAMCDATPPGMRQHGRRQQPLRHRSLPPSKAVLFRMLVVGGVKFGGTAKGSAYVADYGLEREGVIKPVVPTLLNVARDVLTERRQDERRESSHSAKIGVVGPRRPQPGRSNGQRTTSAQRTTPRGRQDGRKLRRHSSSKSVQRSPSSGPLTQEQQRGLLHRLYYHQRLAQDEGKRADGQDRLRSAKEANAGRKRIPHPPVQRGAWESAAAKAVCGRNRKAATAGPCRTQRSNDTTDDTQVNFQSSGSGTGSAATAPTTPAAATHTLSVAGD